MSGVRVVCLALCLVVVVLSQDAPTSEINFECTLRRREVRQFLDASTRTWLLDDDALDTLENDLQRVVNCAEEGDTLLFDVARPIEPVRQVILQRQLTLSAVTQRNRRRNRPYPRAPSPAVFHCSTGVGVFLLETQTATLANLRFEDCLEEGVEVGNSILEVAPCPRGDSVNGTLELHHVTFADNQLALSPALSVHPEACTRVEMLDVAFHNNTCLRFCGAALGALNELTDISVVNNRRSASPSGVPALLGLPPESRTTIRNLTASGNLGPVIVATSANLQILDSRFSQNEGGSTSFEDAFGGGLDLFSSDVEIQRCSFDRNNGTFGSAIYARQSNLRLRDSEFTENTASRGGAAVYIGSCPEATIQNGTFERNAVSGAGAGGAIWAQWTDPVIISQSTFSRNSAPFGGALSITNSSLELNQTQFEENSATDGHGGSIHFAGFNAVFSSNSFTNNTATRFGGAVYIVDSLSFRGSNLTGRSNYAEFGGALCVLGTQMVLTESVFRANQAARQGGGVWTGSGGTSEIVDTLFRRNRADVGSAVYAAESQEISVSRCIFRRNHVTTTGGALWFFTASGSVQGSLFEENSSEGFTGALQVSSQGTDLSRVTVTDTNFTGNRAVEDGGAVTLLDSVIVSFFSCRWEDNQADVYGGGIWISLAALASFTDAQFIANRADSGGAAYLDAANVRFESSQFLSNDAVSVGGGFDADNSTVALQNCRFLQNSAFNGAGLRVADVSVLLVDRCLLQQNRAGSIGGGLYASVSTMVVSNSTFESNSAEDTTGGAIWMQHSDSAEFINITVISNTAVTHGAGIYARRQSNLTISDSYFSQNVAQSLGGGVLTTGSDLRMTNTSVLDCEATTGGGVYTEAGTVVIRQCNISNNFATEDGGGLYVTETEFTAENVTVSRNVADLWGGGIYGNVCPELVISDSVLEHNYAQFGGMSFFSEGINRLSNIRGINNSAFFNGGFSYMRFEAELDVRDSFINDSRAENAAGIYLANSRLNIQSSEFFQCQASHSGGVLSAEEGSFVVISNSTLRESAAELGAGVVLHESYFWGEDVVFSEGSASADGGAIHANFSSSVLCRGCLFERNAAGFRGGAVYLDADRPQLLAFQFDNSTFFRNSAALGGTLTVFEERDRELDCTHRGARCTFLALRGTEFLSNEAFSAGGGLLSTDLNVVRISCSYRPSDTPLAYMTPRQFNRLATLNTTAQICSSWNGNSAETYGSEVASYARAVNKRVHYEETNVTEEVHGGLYVVQDHLSGSQIPSLLLEWVDALGQGPAIGVNNSTLQATLASPDGLFSGSVAVNLMDGRGNISGVAGYREPGAYEVHLRFSDATAAPLTMVVDVRECRVGEAAAANRTICQSCIGDTYNFHPNELNQVCQPCPDEASCDTAMLRPIKGHWHKTPCSTEIQECLTERACDFEGREERLRELINNEADCNFTLDFILTYTQAQCGEVRR